MAEEVMVITAEEVTVIMAEEATTVIITVTTDGMVAGEAGEAAFTAALAFIVVLTIIMEAPIIMPTLA